MKYPKLRKSEYKRFAVGDFGCGIDPSDKTGKALKSATNVQLNSGAVKTRAAIKATGDVLNTIQTGKGDYFTFTDAVILKEGIYTGFTSLRVPLGSYSYRYEFRLFSADGGVMELPSLEFISTGLEDIKMPMSVVCFAAARKSGCGIFAFVGLHTSKSYMYDFEVYELSSDFAHWIIHRREALYTPDYYINGRGNKWYMCDTELPEPEFHEPLNLLSGIANCYYTTDGASNAFFLPIKQLNAAREDYLKVDLQADLSTHLNFTVPYGEVRSNVVDYLDYKLQVVYYGEYFMIESNPSGYVPHRLHGCDNNLKVTIKHETEEDYHKKADMTLAKWYGFSGSGSRLVLAGNTEYPSCLAVSAENNPFYIPHTNVVYVGNTSSKITALLEYDGEVLVVKENEIYKAAVKSGKVSTAFLNGDIGSVQKSAAKSVNRKAFFVGTDNKIYSALPNGKIKNVSGRIPSVKEAIIKSQNVFACTSHDKYILICDNKAFVLDLILSDEALNTPIWYEWSFPRDCIFLGGVSYGERIALVGKCVALTTVYFYSAVLTVGESDIYYPNVHYAFETVSAPITTEILTHPYLLDNTWDYKSVDRVTLLVGCKGVCNVGFTDEKGDIIRSSVINIKNEELWPSVVRLLPFIRTRKCSVSITSDSPLELEGIEFEYNSISN